LAVLFAKCSFKEAKMSVISGEMIDLYRLKTISAGLRLESKGLKGRVRCSVIAREILSKHNKKPEKNLVKLCEQFKNFVIEQEANKCA
jgi:hypothetical protein